MKFQITCIAPGVFRSSQPMGGEDFALIKSLGIETVIDLENQTEEGSWHADAYAEAGVLNVVHVPLSGFFAPDKRDVQAVLVGLGLATAEKRVLVHCLHGQDRTGLVCGLYLRSKGLTRSEAFENMLENGFHPFLLGLSYYFWVNG